jgi:hypothetical protein
MAPSVYAYAWIEDQRASEREAAAVLQSSVGMCFVCFLSRYAIQPRDARGMEAESSSLISISRPCLVIRDVRCHLPD